MARGFFAELQHQAKVAARAEAAAQREADRLRKAALRELEKAKKAEERAAKQLVRAQEADRRQREKEAREAHIATMNAEVHKRNQDLERVYHEIDSLLAATLDVDDYVDLETLRPVVKHPPFGHAQLEKALAPPEVLPDPPEPVFRAPAAPKGLASLFGKRKHRNAVAVARLDHDDAVSAWRLAVAQKRAADAAAAAQHLAADADRVARLQEELARYEAECARREADAVELNQAIDSLIGNLGYGDADAVQEYVSIVLWNSVYPVSFPVSHEFEFDPGNAELKLRVRVPGPDAVPCTKAYKYTKSTDEITSIELSQKARKDRYTSAVHQVALRSLHEVFEADRRGIIKAISLQVGAEATNPATGREQFIPFVAAAAEREAFLELNLSSVIPSATLKHLGASVSKNPFGLVATDVGGVRRS